ncbi:MAG: hypothetical protein EP330_14090 [Deltaproteobacteria bacterium]|nr:MAG: hypothetical protein EP330_14090 [Deltaproteobacteria bacterium]
MRANPGWWLLIMVACGTAQTVPWNPPEQESLDPAWTDCADGEACVVVQLGCCDHCNGGAAVSVRADAVGEVEAAMAEDCGGGEDCTLMGCGAVSAACDAGVCVLLQEQL